VTSIPLLGDWFARAIASHDSVSAVSRLDSGFVSLGRGDTLPVISIAPVGPDRLDVGVVESVLEAGTPTVIVLVPKASHYDWNAREFALREGSSVQTYKELVTFLHQEDPRGGLDKSVAFVKERLEQHSKVSHLEMICEATMRLRREPPLSDILIAVEYDYEFGEESLVRALQRHAGVNAVVNANPNGRPTMAALTHGEYANVPVYRIAEMMGALNFDGSQFVSYTPPRRR
jgi:hypothetical protein